MMRFFDFDSEYTFFFVEVPSEFERAVHFLSLPQKVSSLRLGSAGFITNISGPILTMLSGGTANADGIAMICSPLLGSPISVLFALLR